MGSKHRSNPAVRFMARVDFEGPEVSPELGPCWLWAGAGMGQGYGKAWHEGRLIGAHAASYRLFVGPVPDGHEVCHACDVRLCVRPGHLFTGTRLDNVRDMIAKGRAWPNPARGADHYAAKLSDDKAAAIRLAYAAGGVSQTELAVVYGVAQTTISRVLLGRRWA